MDQLEYTGNEQHIYLYLEIVVKIIVFIFKQNIGWKWCGWHVHVWNVLQYHRYSTYKSIPYKHTGVVVAMIAWQLDLQLPMQSISISIKVMSWNPTHGEVYSIQHCDKVCQWLAAGLWFSPSIKLTATITLTPLHWCLFLHSWSQTSILDMNF